MPVTYEIDAERGVVVVRVYGAVTPQEFAANRVKLQADPEHRPGLMMLVDLRDVESFAMSADEIEGLAQDRTSLFIEPGTPVAIVATSDEAFGLSRMYQIMRGTGVEDIQVFNTMAEAERWLEVQPRIEAATETDARPEKDKRNSD